MFMTKSVHVPRATRKPRVFFLLSYNPRVDVESIQRLQRVGIEPQHLTSALTTKEY